MKSDVVKKGIERAPHRALLRALGCSDKDLQQPFVDLGESFGVVTAQTGDVRARFDVRVGEIAVAAALVADLGARISGRLQLKLEPTFIPSQSYAEAGVNLYAAFLVAPFTDTILNAGAATFSLFTAGSISVPGVFSSALLNPKGVLT